MARTPSTRAHQQVLHAALELIAEQGIEATSMDAIAARSGVSKATIYKHWSDKDALLLEVLAEASGLHARPAFDSGNTRTDLLAVLTYTPAESAKRSDRIHPHLIAYAARKPPFGVRWRAMVMEPPRRELRRILSQGVQRGELPASLDIELSLMLLLGPMIYARIFAPGASRTPRKIADRLAVGTVDAFLRAFGLQGFRVRPPSTGVRPHQ